MEQEEATEPGQEEPEAEVRIAITFSTSRRNSEVYAVMAWDEAEWMGMAEEARQAAVIEYLIVKGLLLLEFDYEHS